MKWCSPRWWLPLQTRIPIPLTGFYSGLSKRRLTYNFISQFSQTQDTLSDSTDSGTISWTTQKVGTYCLTSRSSEDSHIQSKEKLSKDLIVGPWQKQEVRIRGPRVTGRGEGGMWAFFLSVALIWFPSFFHVCPGEFLHWPIPFLVTSLQEQRHWHT